MKLSKKDVIVETIRPTEIRNLKRKGYVEVNEDASEETKELSDMTLNELKGEAKERGLSGYSTLAKEDLLALLEGEGE